MMHHRTRHTQPHTNKPRAGYHVDAWGWGYVVTDDLTVYEPKPEPQESGLLDKNGNPLMRVARAVRHGFWPGEKA